MPTWVAVGGIGLFPENLRIRMTLNTFNMVEIKSGSPWVTKLSFPKHALLLIISLSFHGIYI